MNETDEKITFIVLARNNLLNLKRCINNLIQFDHHVLVLDTGSEEFVLEELHKFGDRIKLIYHPWNYSFSSARNYAIEKSNTDINFFVDSDEYIVSSKSELNESIVRFKKHNFIPYVFGLPRIIDSLGNNDCGVPRLICKSSGALFHGFVHEEPRVLNDNLNQVKLEPIVST